MLSLSDFCILSGPSAGRNWGQLSTLYSRICIVYKYTPMERQTRYSLSEVLTIQGAFHGIA